MNGEDIKALRDRLGCTARALGASLGVDQATVLAWERGERFATRGHVRAMQALAAKGRDALPPAHAADSAAPPWSALADPALWTLVRKLIAHPQLRAEATRLAATYDDPAG